MTDTPPAGVLDTSPRTGAASSPVPGALLSLLRPVRSLFQRPIAQTALALVLALALRVYFLVQSNGMMEGDEAILGIQAERILHGARPIYMYGQAYMASWDAYLAAPLIALFGPSGTVLHAVTLIESLLLVPLFGALATRMFRTERARLPAMLLAAIPPVYVGVVELHFWGGYIETLILGSALLLVTLRIADRWALNQPTHWLWLLAGLLAGFAWWIDPLIIYYLLACALWLTLPAVVRFSLAGERAAQRLARLAPGAIKGALAFGGAALVGAFPAILYIITTPGSMTPGQALPYLSGGAPSGLKAQLRLTLIGYFAALDAPRVAGIEIPWDPFTAHKALNVLVAILPALAALLALWAIALITLGALRVLRLSRADQQRAIHLARLDERAAGHTGRGDLRHLLAQPILGHDGLSTRYCGPVRGSADNVHQPAAGLRLPLPARARRPRASARSALPERVARTPAGWFPAAGALRIVAGVVWRAIRGERSSAGDGIHLFRRAALPLRARRSDHLSGAAPHHLRLGRSLDRQCHHVSDAGADCRRRLLRCRGLSQP